MRNLSQWVVWKLELRDPDKSEGPGNKLTKTPYNAHLIKHNGFTMLPNRGGKAKSNDPTTWCSFQEALDVYQNCAATSGIGFCFGKDDGLAGIDLDHCFDADHKLLPQALEIVEQFLGTYIEYSPSGDGLHIWCKGKVVKPGRRVILAKEHVEMAVEVYDASSARYFTVTGKPFIG
jgi:primase-polymerase (primpol)-like protein